MTDLLYLAVEILYIAVSLLALPLEALDEFAPLSGPSPLAMPQLPAELQSHAVTVCQKPPLLLTLPLLLHLSLLPQGICPPY